MDYRKQIFPKMLQHLRKVLPFVPAIIVMAMIFGLSSQNAAASSTESMAITGQILRLINCRLGMNWTPAQQAYYAELGEFYVRKLAHFGEYALLGVCLVIPLQTYLRKGRLLLSAQAICSAYAAMDEFHQFFSPGRSPQLRDVLIDSTGALAGILIGWLIRKQGDH